MIEIERKYLVTNNNYKSGTPIRISQGYTLWDGSISGSSMIPAGLYVLIIQATNPNGNKIGQKLICIKI